MTKFPEQVRTLKVTLTQDEKVKRGEELAHTVQLLAQVEAEQREVVSSMKAKAEAHRKQIHVLSQAISNGYEYRQVLVDSTPDFEARRVTLFRRDTGEVVEERAMLEHEAQEQLPLEEQHDDEGKVKPPTFEEETEEEDEEEDEDEDTEEEKKVIPDNDDAYYEEGDEPKPSEPYIPPSEKKAALKVVKPDAPKKRGKKKS